MKEKKKDLYEAPVIQVLELKQEGVICASVLTSISFLSDGDGITIGSATWGDEVYL